MIQRKQTIYLLISTVLTTIMTFATLYTLNVHIIDVMGVSESEVFTLSAWGVALGGESLFLTIYFGILTTLAAVGNFVTIFLYRRRWIQVRLCFALMAMQVGIGIFTGYYIYQMQHTLPQAASIADKYSMVILFPVLAILCLFLAYRGVAKDIALLAASDRIR